MCNAIVGQSAKGAVWFGLNEVKFRSPSQHALVWDAAFVQNQFCRLPRCDVALASPQSIISIFDSLFCSRVHTWIAVQLPKHSTQSESTHID